MPKVSAWKCPHTGKLFDIDAREDYDKHLQTLAYERKIQRKKGKEAEEWNVFFDKAKATLKSPDEIIRWFMQNQKRIIARYYRNEHPSTYKTYVVDELRIYTKWRDQCSNTHSAPKSGVTNWHCDKDKPSGYAGYFGNISGRSHGKTPRSSYFDTDMLKMIDVHTGSGGGGGPFRYSVTIFAADWPGIMEARFESKIRGKA